MAERIWEKLGRVLKDEVLVVSTKFMAISKEWVVALRGLGPSLWRSELGREGVEGRIEWGTRIALVRR